MPTYVYECSRCSDVFEVEQRIVDNPLDTCKCGSQGTVKRLIQPVGVMFKGAGFHINDYSGAKSGGSKPEPKVESAPSCTGDKSTCACAPSGAQD